MIFTNSLSLLLFENDQNGFCNRNLCFIQELMCLDNPSDVKFKRVCADYPIIALLTKSAIPRETQVTFGHASTKNKLLG